MTRGRFFGGQHNLSFYWSSGLALFGFLCLIVSVRWWLIGEYGSPIPFWDQWDAEAVLLYKPYVSGHLTWATLISPHNEHRILTTRLLVLGLFKLNGAWNPMLEMAVNAVLLAGTLLMLTGFLAKSLKPGIRIVLCIFLVAFYAVPYAWENTLAGFQGQFYFNMLFSFLSLWLLITRPVLSAGWWGGVLAAIAAYFSLASGIFVLAAAVPVMLLQAAMAIVRSRWSLPMSPDQEPLLKRLAASVVLLAFFVIGYVYTPQLAVHASLKAHSVKEFVSALMATLSWPRPMQWRAVFLMNFPLLLFLLALWRGRSKPTSDATWFLLALAAWAIGQVITLAYGRAAVVLASRYFDLLAIGLIVNFTCFLWVAQSLGPRVKRVAYLACLVWVAYVAVGFYHERHEIGAAVVAKHRDSVTELANVSGYLATGDRDYLYGKPRLDIPYPDPARLQMMLDDPGIRDILPFAVLPSSTAQGHKKGALDDLVVLWLEHAWLIALLGILSLACSGILWIRNRTPQVSDQLVQET